MIERPSPPEVHTRWGRPDQVNLWIFDARRRKDIELPYWADKSPWFVVRCAVGPDDRRSEYYEVVVGAPSGRVAGDIALAMQSAYWDGRCQERALWEGR